LYQFITLISCGDTEMRLFNIDSTKKKWYYRSCLILSKISNDRLGISAAAIAYFTFFSLIPLLLVFLWFFSLWGADSLKAIVMNGIPKLVPISGDLLERIVQEAMSIRLWGFLGIIPLAWAGTSLFYIIEMMINSVWGFPSKGIFKGRLWGTVVVFVFLLFAVFQPVLLYVSRVFQLFEQMLGVSSNSFIVWMFSGMDRWLLMFAVYSVIYYMTPAKKVGVKYAMISSTVATIGTVILEWIFLSYITVGKFFQMYRLIADVMFLLFWFYLMGYIILVGAEVGYFVYHKNRGDLWDELAKFSDKCSLAGREDSQKLLQEASGVSSEKS